MVHSLDRWVGKVAIVTGISAGTGAAITEKLVNAGINVVGLSCRKNLELTDKLWNSKGKLYQMRVDLTNEQHIIDVFEWTKKNVGPIHILINNPSAECATTKTNDDVEYIEGILNCNVLGLCIATREAVKDMRANNVDGHIVHINSVLGHVVSPGRGCNIYSASKHAVTALAETLRRELNYSNGKIKITSVSPGIVKNEFHEASEYLKGPESKDEFEKRPALQPEDVADAVIYTLSTPPHVQVHEILLRPQGQEV